jgi:hypothetical protein
MTEERRAPVQSDGWPLLKHPAGTISWDEHVDAWVAYQKLWGYHQSAERIAERGGFGWDELVRFLGHEPTTWEALP